MRQQERWSHSTRWGHALHLHVCPCIPSVFQQGLPSASFISSCTMAAPLPSASRANWTARKHLWAFPQSDSHCLHYKVRMVMIIKSVCNTSYLMMIAVLQVAGFLQTWDRLGCITFQDDGHEVYDRHCRCCGHSSPCQFFTLWLLLWSRWQVFCRHGTGWATSPSRTPGMRCRCTRPCRLS